MLKPYMWGATVALSWTWGLGFFFTIHFAYLYGWLGLLLFAIPNALGLILFGRWVQKLREREDLRRWIEARIRKWAPLFLAYQAVAVALTVFAFVFYYLGETDVKSPYIWGVVLLVGAMLFAEFAGLRGVVRSHAVLWPIMVGALLFVGFSSSLPAEPVVRSAHDMTFLGFVVPLTLGLLFGPWLDLQQWQRALGMAENGVSVSTGYAVGGGLFFFILFMVGMLTLFIVPESIGAVTSLDGNLHAESALPAALVGAGSQGPVIALGVAAAIAVFSTVDSAQLACRWALAHVNKVSTSALTAMIPEELRTTTFPLFVVAAGLAGIALLWGIDLEYFMIPYATLFLAYALVMVADALLPARGTVSETAVFLTGVVSMALMGAGYFETAPTVMVLAALVPLLVLYRKFYRAPDGSPKLASASSVHAPAEPSNLVSSVRSASGENAMPLAAPISQVGPVSHSNSAAGLTVVSSNSEPPSTGWFEGKWFTVSVIPTYTDTNSVGNVYFASYVTWVGKARELFFRHCMPEFQLDSTEFYILTRAFNHKFMREIREFEKVHIQISIGDFNRKFVKLHHQITNEDGKQIGSGEQTLMFVNSSHYDLIDIPGAVLAAFGRYAPKDVASLRPSLA